MEKQDEPKSQNGLKIGTFAKASTGGRIILDGATVEVGPNTEIGKMFDANKEGTISADSFITRTQAAPVPEMKRGFEALLERHKGKFLVIGGVAAIITILKTLGFF